MSDLINRQDAIDAIADYLSKTTYTSAISFLNTGALILARVPSAELPIKEKCCVCPHCDNCDVNEDGTIEQKRGEWIPCSERLPEKNSEYLVTKVDHITDDSLLDIAVYCDWIQNNNGFYKADEVIAWMPLPEPYSGADMRGDKTND